MEQALIILIIVALLFDFINGFHDSANSIATIVSTRVLTPFQAVLWAAFFNFLAFMFFKDHGVADTVKKMVHEDVISYSVLLSALIGAIFWNLLTWWWGIPSSSSHALLGGFAGAALVKAGVSAIDLSKMSKTLIFIPLAPLIGMTVSYLISVAVLHICKTCRTRKSTGISEGCNWFHRPCFQLATEVMMRKKPWVLYGRDCCLAAW